MNFQQILMMVCVYSAEKHRSEMNMMENSATELRGQIKKEFQGWRLINNLMLRDIL